MEQNTDAGAPVMPISDNKQKSENGLKIVTVIACIVAVCGIGFGVYSFIENSNKSQEISRLKIEMDNLKSGEEENTDAVNVFQNPIIKSEALNGSTLLEEFVVKTDEEHHLYIGVKNGKIDSCYVDNARCEITSLDGNIYKVIEFGRGLDSSITYIGFIMEDGTINYFRFGYDNVSDSSYVANNKLKIDGFVVDGLNIHVPQENYGGYPSTVFVLKDGNYSQFNESML